MPKTFTLAGATGHVGGRASELLLAGGHRVRAIGRDAGRLEPLVARGAEPRVGSLEDADFLAGAFAGADAAFVLVPPNYAAPDHRAFQRAVGEAEATALERAGVPRVVALSSVGAHHPGGTGPIHGLHELEERLRAVPGLAVTAVRAGSFMENFLHSIGLIRSAGINGSSVAPEVALPTVATRDIADVVAATLAGEATPPVRYVLGPRDLTFPEATRMLGEAIGLPGLPYVRFSPEDELQGMIAAGLSPSVAADLVEMHGGFNQGLMVPTVPRSPESTTPTTFEQWVPTFAAAYAAERV